jgi:glycosyltransferase involved in cell wall biosynthesis
MRDVMRALDSAEIAVSAASTRTKRGQNLEQFDVSYATPSLLSTVAERAGIPGNNVDGVMFARLALALRRQVVRHDANLVHAGFASHTFFSMICDVPPSVPFIAQLFGKVEHQEWLEQLGTFDRVDAYVTCSDEDVETLRSLGVPSERVHRITPPIYPPEGDRTAGRRLLEVDDDSFVVGYLGNSDEERLPTAFLERFDEFAAAANTEAIIVTKELGDRRQTFDTFSNLRTIERALSEAEKAAAFAGPDVWVFPFDFEDPDTAPVIDPPLSVLEALAAGRPVVTTRSLSLPSYVPDGEAGILHNPGDNEGIIGSLRKFRDGGYDTTAFGRHAQQYAERELSPSRTASELRDIYEGVLTRR